MSVNASPIETRTGCIEAAMEVIGQKWTALILRDLASESRRFAELERSIEGLNPRTLSQRLEAMKAHDIICDCADGGYELTQKGRDLIPILEAMAAWGDKHHAK